MAVLEPGPPRGSRRRARTTRLRRLPLPGSRLRGADRGEAGAGRGRAAPHRRASPSRRSSRSCPRRRSSTTATSSSTRSRDAVGPALGFHKAGRWDEVLEVERCWLTTELGNAIRNACATGRARSRLPATTRRTQRGLPAAPRRPGGRNTGQALVQLVTAPGERFERGPAGRGAAPLPRGALDPLVGQRDARRGDEPADAGCSGARTRSRRSPVRPALPRAPERLPPDEHRDGRARLRAGARVRRR